MCEGSRNYRFFPYSRFQVIRTMPTFLGRCRQALASCLLSLLWFPPIAPEPRQLLRHPVLKDQTLRAFNSYVSSTDTKNARSLTGGNFLWIDDQDKSARDTAYEKLHRGDVLMQRISSPGRSAEIPGGLVHDWEGIIFIPGAKLQDVLAILQDYNHQAAYFAPDVEQARIEEHNGDNFRVFLRFRRVKIITVVLDTEHNVTYFRDSATRAHSRSSAIRIAEVENPGTKSEKEDPPGQDSGFLWRMETWWRLEEKDGGVYLQNQVISLTRDIPAGLGWAVEPFVTSIPKESLEFTLGAVRRAVLAKTKP
jgi:hypothetical protein